ncbi:hypothetical protein BH10ACT3_BH10ACT3_22350 [soil metagenome]
MSTPTDQPAPSDQPTGEQPSAVPAATPAAPAAPLERSLWLDALPVVLAIGGFGIIFGATAEPLLGASSAIWSSVLLFSGAAQFSMLALERGGADAGAIIGATALLGLRHIPLAALVRARLPHQRWLRGLVGLGLIDETVGLAVSSTRPAARTIAVVGGTSYIAWVIGTVAGGIGADLPGLRGVSDVIPIVLFVGLAVLTCAGCAAWTRVGVSAAVTVTIVSLVPGAGAAGALAAAVVVALIPVRTAGAVDTTNLDRLPS